MSSKTADRHEGSSDPEETGSPSSEARRPLDLKAGLFVFFVSTLWSGNWIAIKAGLDYAPALRLGWMRFAVGGIFVLCWAVYTRADLRIHSGEWWPLIWLAILLVVQIILLNLGITYTTAGHASVLIVTSAIWVTVLSHFFIPGDHLSPVRLIGILIAYLGIIVISGDSLTETDVKNLILGDILVAISGFLLGVRIVYNARVIERIDAAKTLLFQAVSGTVVLLALSTVFEPDPWLWTWQLAASISYQGFVIAGFGFLALLLMSKYFFPSRISAISMTQPVTGILLAWVILDEDPTELLWVGGFLVMGGALLAQRRSNSDEPTALSSTAKRVPVPGPIRED